MFAMLALVNLACGNPVIASILMICSIAAQVAEHREDEARWEEERAAFERRMNESNERRAAFRRWVNEV